MEVFIIVTVLWVFSVCLHEFGHAWVAYRGGDHTVKEKGYLTLNPVRYTHPVYSILMPVLFMMLGGIGLPGGAVYIERQLLRSRAWETSVSLAGPAMNLIMIFLLGLVFKSGWLTNDPQSLASVSMAFLMQLQISAFILNLLPIPPLDGFQAIAPWMREDIRANLYAASNQTILILFLALWFITPLNVAFWLLVSIISAVFGVDSDLAYAGWIAYRFWE